MTAAKRHGVAVLEALPESVRRRGWCEVARAGEAAVP
jgi:hypothetical protein